MKKICFKALLASLIIGGGIAFASGEGPKIAKSISSLASAKVEVSKGAKEVENIGGRPLTAGQMPGAKPGQQARMVAQQSPSVTAMSLPSGLELYGALISCDDLTANPCGIYKLASETEISQVYTNSTIFKSIYAAVYCGDKYRVVTPNISGSELMNLSLYTLGTASWNKLSEAVGSPYFSPTTLAYDPVDDEVYVCGSEEKGYYETSYYLGTVDLSTGTVYKVCDLGKDKTYQTMAFDNEGQLYAVCKTKYNEPVNLVKVNKYTGEETMVGATGLRFTAYLCGMCYDAASGKLIQNHYAYDEASSGLKSMLYEIDPTTGAATFLCYMPQGAHMIGLYTPSVPIADNAPAAATDLALNFVGAALEGTLTFKAPATYNDGTAATGNVTYTVKSANGDVIATGTTTYGAEVSVPVTVTASGTYTYTVVMSNDNGNSKVASVSKYIGSALAAPATNVVMSYENDSLKVSWTASAPATQGFFEADSVTYDIVLNPGEVVIGENVKGTEFCYEMAEPDAITAFTVTVTAKYNGVAATAATSNTLTLGSIVPPFEATMQSAEDFNGFTVEDCNNDSKKWYYDSSNKCIRMSYNSSMSMDDWAFLPPAKLEKGKVYSFSFDAKSQSNNYLEKIEAKVGKSSTASAMTAELIAVTTLPGTYTTLQAYFVPEETGVYYFGLHGVSDKDKYYLSVQNIRISAPIEGNAPGAPTDFTATRDESGALKATLSLKAPAVDTEGTALDTIYHLDIVRDSQVIKSFASPEVGGELSFVDEAAPEGDVEYTAIAYNLFGAGLETKASVFVGFAQPAAAAEVTVALGSCDSEAIVTWTAVTTDIKDNTLPADSVKYNLYRAINGNVTLIAPATTDLTFTDKPFEADDDQQMVIYVVETVFGQKLSKMAVSDVIVLGKPYDVPFADSFIPSTSSACWSMGNATEGTYWGMIDQEYVGVNSFDDNSGMAVMVGQSIDDTAMLYTGSYKVAGLTDPKISFYYYDYNSQNTLELMVNDFTGWKSVKTITLGGEEGWKRVVVDASDYNGKNIQIGFRGTCLSTKYLFVDKVAISEIPAVSVAVESFVVPAQAYTVQGKFSAAVSVVNNGIEDIQAGSYKVEFYVAGEKAAEKEGVAISGGDKVYFTFNQGVDVFSAEKLEVYVQIVPTTLTGDAAEDNQSETVEVAVVKPEYPAVTDLSGKNTEDGIVFEWTAPTVNKSAANSLLDSAEEYVVFSTGMEDSDLATADNVGAWTMVDQDKGDTYCIKDQYGMVVEYKNFGAKMAFQVFDGPSLGLTGWTAHTGNQMFVCFGSQVGKNDDWMISPELPGQAQTITFYAKSITAQYGYESFEVLYSTGSVETDDFVIIGSTNVNVPTSWTKYEFELPEGARRFAIRCVSDDKFAFCVDDIEYIALDPVLSTLEVKGYNVYADGVKINDALVAAPTFTTPFVSEEVEYCVTVLYNHGESVQSNVITVVESGINSVGAALKITAGRGFIEVSGAQAAISVVAADGKVIASTADSALRAEVPTGIYLVKVGNAVHKVAVK